MNRAVTLIVWIMRLNRIDTYLQLGRRNGLSTEKAVPSTHELLGALNYAASKSSLYLLYIHGLVDFVLKQSAVADIS